jgi:DNA-binding winged helix-turn-helix (wHTH) protein/TolB-like protein
MNLERFQFGEFEFDSGSRVLTHKGRQVKIQAQPALLLGVLLARRGQIVSREDLKLAIWGNDTHVDFERGLNFCVGQIRAALRDDASRPVYIRTVPKRGYEFMAPVIAIAPQTGPVESGTPVRIPRAGSIRLAALTIVAAAIVAAAVAFVLRANTPAIPNLAVVRFDAGTNMPTMRDLADELTDDVTVRLASASHGRYRVIGSASILRTPRDQRDLRVIASSLQARYAVLGQVQPDGDQVLVLAHLIRLSDLTHIWVVRFERKIGDSSMLESQVAGEIASQFAAIMSNQPERAASFTAGSR